MPGSSGEADQPAASYDTSFNARVPSGNLSDLLRPTVSAARAKFSAVRSWCSIVRKVAAWLPQVRWTISPCLKAVGACRRIGFDRQRRWVHRERVAPAAPSRFRRIR
jgi:hypothetical protein